MGFSQKNLAATFKSFSLLTFSSKKPSSTILCIFILLFLKCFGGKSSGSGGGGGVRSIPGGGDVFCQIILLYRFIAAIKAKPSLTMHQIQGNSLKVQSEPVASGSLPLNPHNDDE